MSTGKTEALGFSMEARRGQSKAELKMRQVPNELVINKVTHPM